jgi:hypothetical protein
MKGFRPGKEPKLKQKTLVILVILTQEQVIKTALMEFIFHCLMRNANQQDRFEFSYIFVDNHRPVEYARNIAVQEFRRATDGRDDAILWFIDSDMVPPRNYNQQLLIDADMGAGRAYGINGGQLFTCIERWKDGGLRHLAMTPQATGVVDVDASGTGGLWIHKRILQDKRMWVDEEGNTFQTLRDSSGKTTLSEDLDFTHRATKLGYKLRADISVKWSHFKEVDLLSLEGGIAAESMEQDLARGRAENQPVNTNDPFTPEFKAAQ